MPGLLDMFSEEDLLKLKNQVLNQQQANPREPLISGLLSAGLGILANSRNTSPWEAIGKGGLLGLDAMTQARQRQTKDPMAQLSAMGALQGIAEKIQMAKDDARLMQRYPGLMQQGGQPQEQGPEPLGFAAQDAPPMPQGMPGAMPPGQGAPGAYGVDPELIALALSRSPRAQALAKLFDERSKPFELSSGQQRYTMGPNGAQVVAENVDTNKPRYDRESGRAAFVPGAAEELARAKELETGVTERIKAALAPPVRVPDGQGGWKFVRPNAPINDAEQRAAAIADNARSGGGPMNFTGSGLGFEPSEAELARRKQQALMPGSEKQTAQTKAVEVAYDTLKTAGDMADKASETNTNFANIKEAMKGGAYGNMLAKGIQGAVEFLTALGVPVDRERMVNSRTMRAELERASLQLVKSYVGSQNVSNMDLLAVKESMPRFVDDPEARWKLIQHIEARNNAIIERHAAIKSHLQEHPNLLNFEDKWKRAEVATGSLENVRRIGAQQRKEAGWRDQNAQAMRAPTPPAMQVPPPAPAQQRPSWYDLDMLRRRLYGG